MTLGMWDSSLAPFFVDPDIPLVLRSMVFRSAVGGPIHAHLRLTTTRDELLVQIRHGEGKTLRRLSRAFAQIGRDIDAISAVDATFPNPRTNLLMIQPPKPSRR